MLIVYLELFTLKYRNYEKNFELTNQPVNGTNETKEIFFITFTISLASNRVNGIYPIEAGKEKTTELTLRFRVSQGTPEGNYPVQIGMSYDDPKANTYSSAGNFTVTVIQPLDVELTIPKIEKELVAGDTIPLNFQVMNLGRSQIFNVRCDVTGNGLVQTKAAFIGNMESGTAGEAAANVFIDRLEGVDSYGETTGTITLTYEDSLGSEYSQEYTFDTAIIKPVTSEALTQAEEEPVSQWWVSILIVGGIGLLAAVGAGAYLLGRKQR